MAKLIRTYSGTISNQSLDKDVVCVTILEPPRTGELVLKVRLVRQIVF